MAANNFLAAKSCLFHITFGGTVLNTSPFPLLHNTFRVSIGAPEENDAFVQCLIDSMEQETLRQEAKVRFMGRSEQLQQLQAVG